VAPSGNVHISVADATSTAAKPTNITIPDGPSEWHAVLTRRAKRSRRSLESYETMSALRRLCVVHRTLTPRRFAVAVRDLALAFLERHPSAALLRRVYDLGNKPTVCAAAYVALAEALECALVTTDANLAGAPGPRCSSHLLTSPENQTATRGHRHRTRLSSPDK
jgi:predicted nucleic acid-binding protein